MPECWQRQSRVFSSYPPHFKLIPGKRSAPVLRVTIFGLFHTNRAFFAIADRADSRFCNTLAQKKLLHRIRPAFTESLIVLLASLLIGVALDCQTKVRIG